MLKFYIKLIFQNVDLIFLAYWIENIKEYWTNLTKKYDWHHCLQLCTTCYVSFI